MINFLIALTFCRGAVLLEEYICRVNMAYIISQNLSCNFGVTSGKCPGTFLRISGMNPVIYISVLVQYDFLSMRIKLVL